MDQTRGGNEGMDREDGRGCAVDAKDIKEVGRQVRDQSGNLVR
jgi:hypothetical protein